MSPRGRRGGERRRPRVRPRPSRGGLWSSHHFREVGGSGSDRRVLLSIQIPGGARHNFEMEAGIAHEIAEALIEKADAEDLPVDSPV
jgi:hypothetical protein